MDDVSSKSNGNHGRTFAVALMGGRMQWAVPRILSSAGLLERLFTDLCASKGWPKLLELIPAPLQSSAVKRILGRVPEGVPASTITAFNRLGVRYAWQRVRARSQSELTRTYLWTNRSFCQRVCVSDWGNARGVFTFNCAGLEVLQRAKREGLRTVVEQTIAPRGVEERLLREERALHPGWEQQEEDPYLGEYCQREQEEWGLADVILCGSEFVRQGIGEVGGPVEKCRVVPYGIEVPGHGCPRSDSRSEKENGGSRPLRVLTVGVVSLRKGVPYVLEAAKRLQGVAEFRLVGPIGILPPAQRELRKHVSVSGPVPGSEVWRHYQWADVLFLPSICEGSATATYEALATGLPVVCTPNTGSVVHDGVEGFVVPVRDLDGMVARLADLAKDVALRSRMSASALERARHHDLGTYATRLLEAISGPVGKIGRQAQS